jgi:hypothetical protein
MPSYLDNQSLRRELLSESALAHLGMLKRRHAHLEHYPTWSALIAAMHDMTFDPIDKDDTIASLVRTQQESPHPVLGAVLLLVFKPGLCRLFRRKHGFEPDIQELWAEIHVAFLDAVQTVDVDLHAGSLAKAIFRVTYNHVKLACERRARFHRRWRDFEGNLDEFESEAAKRAEEELAQRDVFETYDRLFCTACEAGVIDTTDRHILIGTVIYNLPLAEYARQNGRSYEGYKKRRQRALRALRAWKNL